MERAVRADVALVSPDGTTLMTSLINDRMNHVTEQMLATGHRVRITTQADLPPLPRAPHEVLEAELEDARKVVRLLMDGWTVSTASLYDEEGVEGWHWVSPEGDDAYVMGDWDELPPPPEED